MCFYVLFVLTYGKNIVKWGVSMTILDNIAAIVTAMGVASVGIIRISGPEAIEIASKVYKGKKDLTIIDSHKIVYGHVYDYKNNKTIDEAIFLIMKEPASFTGENVVEIQCHGGMVSIRQVLELVLRNGARIAEPGEFSKRAFLNGKLDLAQAEAIMDIVNAKTDKSLESAVNQLQGNLSSYIKEFRDILLELIAYIEADIDFPEDDIERLSTEEQEKRIASLIKKLNDIIETQKRGKIIREGLNLVIVGKPNVGKSSLLNALIRENKAIVTDIPGTTRDAIEEFINLNGIPIKVIDTAGIRETSDVVEKIGVKKSKEYITKADLVLFLLDIASGITHEDLEILNTLNELNTIVVVNKIDLDNNLDNIESIKKQINNIPLLKISVKENRGLKELENYIVEMFFQGKIDISNEIIITNARHLRALQVAHDNLVGAYNSINYGMPGDFLAIDLRSAWENLGEITGETLEEDIIDKIFSQFCLGK